VWIESDALRREACRPGEDQRGRDARPFRTKP
jgi:hypothetical protein